MNQPLDISHPWIDRVADYLDQLEFCVTRLNSALDEMRLGTKQLKLPQLESAHSSLSNALRDLESLIAAREGLIHADDVPYTGASIREILGHSTDILSRELNRRCIRLSKDVDLSRERAVSLFVCQFHLADLSENLLALLRGAPGPRATYSNGQDVRRPATMGGSILNKSA